MTTPTPRLPSFDGNLVELNCSSNGEAKWKAVVPPATQVGPPKLTRAPKMETHADPVVAPVAQMPHLIPMPGMDVNDDSVFDDSEISSIKQENMDNTSQDIHSDGMDISDADEYKEEEVALIANLKP